MAVQYPIRVPISTLNRWLKKKVEPIFRRSVLLGKLKSLGAIEYGAGGTSTSWVPSFLRRDIVNLQGDTNALTFPKVTTETQATLPWSFYGLGESIGEVEILLNKNADVQIFDLVERVVGRLSDDFTESYRLRLWRDGTTGTKEMMGIQSAMGYSGALTPNGGSTIPFGSSSWWAMAPSNVYAGLSCVLGNKVNAWDTTTPGIAWPVGVPLDGNGVPLAASVGYCYWSPLIVDYCSKAFQPYNPAGLTYNSGAASTLYPNIHGWDSQWQQAINACSTYLGVLQSQPVDVVVLDPDLYRRAEDSNINAQRFQVTSSSEMRSLGFKSIEWNGKELMYEFGVPVGWGFLLNFSKMKLRVVHKQLIEKTEDTDIVTAENLHRLHCLSQLQMDSPAFFGALVAGTSAGT
jgi:hypothetical protein